jgi:hypothetical protein
VGRGFLFSPLAAPLTLSISRPQLRCCCQIQRGATRVGEPGGCGSGRLCLGRVLRCALTTHAIVIIQVERFVGGGAGMQRALVVGMSLACLNTVGMTGGWVTSGGEEEAFGFSAPGVSVRGGITVNS